MSIEVVLVEPRLYVNVGHIARIMKNFGVVKLFLVDPSYDTREARRFAMHGRDILESATIITDLKELRQSSKLLVGTTALKGSTRLNVLRNTVSLIQLADLINILPKKEDVCIVLGREASGLKNCELEMCDLVMTIETGTHYRTMNISHALAIILYEITKQGLQNLTKTITDKPPITASRSETNLLTMYISNAAERAGYDKHKKHMLDSAVKRLIAKSNPSSKEVMLMVSLFRKCILQMERHQNPLVSQGK
jgi:tRNA/rRNA methyltransferase